MTAPPVPRSVRADWDRLRLGDGRPPAFDPTTVAGLPGPARRWLRHAIAPGTPLWPSVELTMHGEIRLGTWRRFTARQVLAPPRGFVWAARTRLFGLPVTGFDRLTSGSGAMRWRLAGLVPVLSATGPDVTRSAAGRLAGEMVLAPTTALAASWSAGADGEHAVAATLVAGVEERTELHVGPDGRLLDVRMQRWGDPDGVPFGRHPFGVTVDAEATFAGMTIPSVFRAAWWWGTNRQEEGEFFRAEVTGASPG